MVPFIISGARLRSCPPSRCSSRESVSRVSGQLAHGAICWSLQMRRLILLSAVCAFSLRAADVPRPEYPRPQFERSEWMNLNGPWQFAFDDADAGLAAHWEARDHALPRTITVPFAFETRDSGIGEPSF